MLSRWSTIALALDLFVLIAELCGLIVFGSAVAGTVPPRVGLGVLGVFVLLRALRDELRWGTVLPPDDVND